VILEYFKFETAGNIIYMFRVPELRIKKTSYLVSVLSCGTSRRAGPTKKNQLKNKWQVKGLKFEKQATLYYLKLSFIM